VVRRRPATDPPTWGRLIRLALAAGGAIPSREDVRRYQVEHLGRNGGATLLTELLPLPSPSAGQWAYGEWSSLPELRNRSEYTRSYAPQRAAHLRERRKQHRPATVIFYGLRPDYQPWWETISGAALEHGQVGRHRIRMGSDGHTDYVVTPHPAARGPSSEFWLDVGRLVAELGGRRR
jgi:hypothetical protein